MPDKKRGQSPFLYFDYFGTEKNERRKKGDCPLFLSSFFFRPEGKKCRQKKEELKKKETPLIY